MNDKTQIETLRIESKDMTKVREAIQEAGGKITFISTLDIIGQRDRMRLALRLLDDEDILEYLEAEDDTYIEEIIQQGLSSEGYKALHKIAKNLPERFEFYE